MTTEQPMLPADFPEPVLTCDLIIERELKDALSQQEYWLYHMRQHMNFELGDKSDAAQAVHFRSLMHLHAHIQSAAVANLLQTIQGMAPGLADGIARDFNDLFEWGETGELLWEWATDRGLDPEAIAEEAQFKLAQAEKAPPCADKSAAKGAAAKTLEITDLVVDVADRGFRALTTDDITGAMGFPASINRHLAAKKYRETVDLDAAEHPELATLEHDIATSIPYNKDLQAIIHYVARHLYVDGYRKPEGTK